MAMLSNHELSKIRKNIWFFVIKDRKTPSEHEKCLIRQLEDFAASHQNTRWAINPRFGNTEGISSARVVILMQNSCSLLSLKKAFKNPECRFDLKSKSIWSYLNCDGKFDKEFIITSQNWDWGDAGFGNDLSCDGSQRQPVINFSINNLYILTDEDGKKTILGSLSKQN